MSSAIFTILLFATAAFSQEVHRPLKIIAYPYIPDLNGDDLLGLKAFLEARFLIDTGRQIEILFDLQTFATDTYTPSAVVEALSPSGGYDLQEIDTLIMGYLLQNNSLQEIPSSISFDGFGPEVIAAVNIDGTKWGHPSYTCTNVYYSYDHSIRSNKDGDDFIDWMNHKRSAGQLGWTGDLSQGLSLRLQYHDGWRDSHPTTPWFPDGYDPLTSNIDTHIVSNIIALRDSCAKDGNNDCTDSDFYFGLHHWLETFVNEDSLVAQGFPEYTADILEIANTDPLNPTKKHVVAPALVGSGDRPYLFTDAWVISRTNCVGDCLTTAEIFLAWQRTHWAQLITLGKDLSPVRPRYLAIAYQPFYSSPELHALPHFARDYFAFFNAEVNRAVAQDTNRFWDQQDAQAATLQSLITTGYTP